MEKEIQELSSFLQHLKTGKAKGLDVPFALLGQSGAYKPASLRYPITEVDPLCPTYPRQEDKLSDLISALEQELSRVTTAKGALNMLERFAGFVAAVDQNNQEIGGVSWFDAAKQRMALQTCGDRVLILRTDISGIQDFIYAISSTKALKSLRARSFYVEMLAVHTLCEILRRTGLTRAHVAYIGGGGYQLYLPPSCREQVEDYTRRFDDWLWSEHGGTLGLSWAFEEVSRAEAEAGTDVQKQLSTSLGEQKARRRAVNLADVFSGATDPHARIAREESLAERLVEFGALLPKADFLEVMRGSVPSHERGWITLEGVSYRPCRDKHESEEEKIALNAFHPEGYFPMLTGNYVTRVNDIPTEWQVLDEENPSDGVSTHRQLVELALGQRRLALFRCDADNMGSFFSGGIPSHNAMRHATLSRLMSLFFQGYVNAICRYKTPLLSEVPQAPRTKQHGRYLNIIYSGGDDAVVVGPWNEVLTFAVDLRRDYRRFTGGNESLGLSGGAFIAQHDFPLHRMAERAHEAEQLAKQAIHETNGKRLLKDGFVPFLTADTPAEEARAATRWSMFTALDQEKSGIDLTLDILQEFLRLQKPNADHAIALEVSSGFLWKLKAFAEREEDVWRLPLLHYAIARTHVPDHKKSEWEKLQLLLKKTSTWPHLEYVLGFLHLARPLPENRPRSLQE